VKELQMTAPNVLVVDDDVETLEIEEFLLTRAGYRTQTAGSVSAAAQVLSGERPDLVLLDIVMPRVDGWNFLELASRLPVPPPVLVVSGFANADVPEALRPWLTGYLVKPFNPERLMTACRHAMTAPRLCLAGGGRRETRRTFVSDVTAISERGGRHEGYLQDISPCGLRVDLGARLRVGELVRLSVHAPWRRPSETCAGRVCWSRSGVHGIQAMGAVTALERLFHECMGSA
jgi:CheY-like chemotaxis protein